MFCPGCGNEEKQPIQFCRTCGTSFRPVTDAVTASAISAREEIGRAMADKIREFTSAKDLKKVAEDVLPELEKFLESPAEKRLRRIRAGMMMMFIGLGAMIGLTAFAIASKDPDRLFLAAAGLVAFCVGLGIMLNGYFHTVPKGEKGDADASTKFAASVLGGTTSDLQLPEGQPEPARGFRSVTEGTTTHLGDKIRP